jgi:prepilin-type N-terminal cleavage/methylation domain-containing protein
MPTVGIPFFWYTGGTVRKVSQRIAFEAGGFTLIELLIVVAIICILGGLAVPSILRARMTANEAAAIGSLRAINTAQSGYSASATTGGYASLLSVLAVPCPGGSTGFISPDLAADPSRKSGYIITLGPGAAAPGPADCNGTVTAQGYYLTAVPNTTGMTGHRGFATSSRSVIYFDSTGLAPTEAAMAPGGGGAAIQ